MRKNLPYKTAVFEKIWSLQISKELLILIYEYTREQRISYNNKI